MRHKRSVARFISTPFATASSNMMVDASEDAAPSHDFSAQELTRSDGYSSMFTSGLLRNTPHARIPSPPPRTPARTTTSMTHRTDSGPSSSLLAPPPLPPHLSPSKLAPPHTPRRRSSIIHATPGSASPRTFKSSGADNGVERALEGVMRSLKIASIASPRTPKSRWSDDSDGERAATPPPRKSFESVRSRLTSRSTKSSRSLRRDAMEVDENVPPVPQTPRSRRMMDGLVRKLGLTPKKIRVAVGPPPLPAPSYPPPLPPVPPVPPADRAVLRKGSLSTLRSAVTKKGSSTTLRSVRTVAPQRDDLPPVPRWMDDTVGDGCIPSTPKSGRRTPKSSIGPPRPVPEVSPSKFLAAMPRRAPQTPRRASQEGVQVRETTYGMDVADVVRAGEDVEGDADMADGGEGHGDTATYAHTPAFRSRFNATPFDTPELDFDATPGARPSLDVGTPDTDSLYTPESRPSTSTDESFGTFAPYTPAYTPLTAKAARAAAVDPPPKHRRLLNLLASHPPRPTAALQTPSSARTQHKKSLVPGNAAMSASAAFLSPAGLPTSTPTPTARSRDPLGILARKAADEPIPPRGGAGDGWSTPIPPLEPTKQQLRAQPPSSYSEAAAAGHVPSPSLHSTHTFGGRSSQAASHASRPSGPDFTRTPPSSPGTTETDEWELEAYLDEDMRV